ncbi:hypothetical protein OG613_45225 (plasmid) [Streptomyces sp. NBC_00015]|uniref:hypothetical protein n=1 Tax=unclassified Streptomyces TaxID=2593676 RepID=UPI002F90AB4B
MLPLLLPTAAAALTTLITTIRTEAMRRRHENPFLGKAVEDADYTAGLNHIARIRYSAASPPLPDPAAQTQQPAEPPTPPP